MIPALFLSAALAAPASPEARSAAAFAAFHRAEACIASARAATTSGAPFPEITSYGTQRLGPALVVLY